MTPEALHTIVSNLNAAGAELRHITKYLARNGACECCGTFYAEPGSELCRPCMDTAAEVEAQND